MTTKNSNIFLATFITTLIPATIVADVRLSVDTFADIPFQLKQSEQGSLDDFPRNLASNGSVLNGEPVNGPLDSIRYDIPSQFCYKGLQNQFCRNNDQFLRSNIDNEANRRRVRFEQPHDMLPCRQPVSSMVPMEYQRGQTVQLPLTWNNQHDSSCEVNLWYNQMNDLCPVKRPFKCGGGYANANYEVKIPLNVPGCASREDGCFLQMYGHSVEPRTYAMCIHFVLSDAPAVAADTADPLIEEGDMCIRQDPIYFQDSYDTSHFDSEYSVYRGQQKPFARDEILAVL
jgi:hypothetical protein